MKDRTQFYLDSKTPRPVAKHGRAWKACLFTAIALTMAVHVRADINGGTGGVGNSSVGGASGAAGQGVDTAGTGGHGGFHNDATAGAGTSGGTPGYSKHQSPARQGGSGGVGAGSGGSGESTSGGGGGGGGGGGISSGGGGGGDGNELGYGGGGGGGGGATGTLLTGGGEVTSVTGGNGGTGGRGGTGGSNRNGGGGGGGGGGIGAILASGTYNVGSSQTVAGGNGGTGGNGGGLDNAGGGGGGAGAHGLQISSGVLVNSGTIRGGNGGVGGTGVHAGSAGSGGNGITASNATIDNRGLISSGTSGANVRANAITFTGGSNRLIINVGSQIDGNVSGTGADNLTFGGSGETSFNATELGTKYTGFSSYTKQGDSRWTLTGSNSVTGGWSIQAGALLVESSYALGSGRIVVDGSTTTFEVDNSSSTTTLRNEITLNHGATLVNNGVLTGTATGSQSAVVWSSTGGAIVRNYRAINTTYLDGINLRDGGQVENYGTISVGAGHMAILTAGRPSTVVNSSDGVIHGELRFHVGGTLTNSGTINNTSSGVRNDTGTLTILNTGQIIATDYGVGIEGVGVVENSGFFATIMGHTGIRLRGGTITNTFGSQIIGGSGGYAIEGLGSTHITNGGGIYGDVQLQTSGTHVVRLEDWGVIGGNLNIGTNRLSQLILAGTDPTGAEINNYSDAVLGSTEFYGTLRKQGDRTWRLDTQLLNAESIQVEQGKLIFSTLFTGTSVSVASGATLEMEENSAIGIFTPVNISGTIQGQGRVEGTTTISGVLSASGAPDATMIFSGSMTLTEDATTVFVISPQVDGGMNTSVLGYDITLGGDLRITFSGLLEDDAFAWDLIRADILSGNFDTVGLRGLYNFDLTWSGEMNLWSGTWDGYAWAFDSSNGRLSAEAVPEPSVVLLLVIGLGAVFWRHRCRKLAV